MHFICVGFHEVEGFDVFFILKDFSQIERFAGSYFHSQNYHSSFQSVVPNMRDVASRDHRNLFSGANEV